MLAIAVGAVVVETVVLLMNFGRVVFVSDRLTEWYTRYRLAALLMDVLIVIIVVSLGERLGEALGTGAILPVLCLQLAHDLLFWWLFTAHDNYIFDFFKAYAQEVGYHALWSDALMVLGTLGISRVVTRVPPDGQLLGLLVAVYVCLFALYTKPPKT